MVNVILCHGEIKTDIKYYYDTNILYMWERIVNPKTGRKVNINGKLGRHIIMNYINQLGGYYDKDNGSQVIPVTYKKKSRRQIRRKQRGGGTVGEVAGKAAGKKQQKGLQLITNFLVLEI